MAVIANPINGANPIELEINSPWEEFQPLISNETITIDKQTKSNESQDAPIFSEEELEPLVANETSTDTEKIETTIIDDQSNEFQKGAMNISLNPDIVVTITNDMEKTKRDANYDTKGIYKLGIYVISSSRSPLKPN